MVVNFRAREISQGMHKLIKTFILIKKIKPTGNTSPYHHVILDIDRVILHLLKTKLIYKFIVNFIFILKIVVQIG
jgi:hypothetical protein